MNQPKHSIEAMSESDWQQMPEIGKRLIEKLVAMSESDWQQMPENDKRLIEQLVVQIERLGNQCEELNGETELSLAKFIAAFGEFGLIGEEIADIIWLALEIQQYEQPSSPTKYSLEESKFEKSDNLSDSPIDLIIPSDPFTPSALPLTPTPSDFLEQPDPSSIPALSDLPDQLAPALTPAPSDSPKQVKVYASEEQPDQKSASASRDLAIRLPDARSLQEPLTLTRALRPLLRRVPSVSMVLDEEATIERIAEEQLWSLVLKPDLEPWLELALVVDESKSMLLWQPTIRELQRVLERYGIFRDVRTWGMVTEQVVDEDGQAQEQVRIRPRTGKVAPNQRTRSPGELIDPQGRRLVLIATDCVASHWHDGTVLPALKTWSQSGSTAIIQMLPEWLWSRTALGLAAPVRFQAIFPGLPNQRLKAKPLSAWDEIDFETGIKVPIVTLEPEIFTVWSQLVAGKGGVWAPGFVFEPELFEPDEAEENSSDDAPFAEQRVRQFYNSASPVAWKLVCLLAASPIICLPVVRIIQNELLPKSRQVHVAEVFLGGLLSPLQPLSEITPDTNPDKIFYDFVEGVRETLLESSLRSDSVNVLAVVSQFVDGRMGRSLEEFVGYLRDLNQIIDSEIQPSPIATVTAQILKQLGGEYARYAEQLEGINELSTDEGSELPHTAIEQDQPEELLKPVQQPQEQDSLMKERLDQREVDPEFNLAYANSREEQTKSSARRTDFSRMNMRGRSFKGQNLVGADFSYADIRGADFTEASLIGANFTEANAGSQFLGVLGNTKFNNADLTDANFKGAILRNVDLRNAKLTRTFWGNVEGLDTARVDGTYLTDPQLRVLLTTLNGKSQNFDSKNLKGLNLRAANLQNASFIEANLNEACLRMVDLTNAKLVRAQLAEADLDGARLTGACIQDWSISASTNLNNVLCEYIYMRLPTKDNPDPYRKPDNRREVFHEGDFANFIAPIIKTLDLYHNQNVDMRQVRVEVKTLDLYHHEGIDPTAATIALRQLAEANPQVDLQVVALEGQGDNRIRIQTSVRDEADRSELSSEYFQKYRELTSLPPQILQKLSIEATEKDERIRLLEETLITAIRSPKFYVETSYTSEEIKLENGVLIDSNVNQTVKNTEANNYATNTLSQLSDASDLNEQGIKTLLVQLKTAIEGCSELTSSDKDEMFEQVATIAKAAQDPQDNALKKLVVTAIKIIKGTVVGIPVDSDLTRTSNRVLPVIMSLLDL